MIGTENFCGDEVCHIKKPHGKVSMGLSDISLLSGLINSTCLQRCCHRGEITKVLLVCLPADKVCL